MHGNWAGRLMKTFRNMVIPLGSNGVSNIGGHGAMPFPAQSWVKAIKRCGSKPHGAESLKLFGHSPKDILTRRLHTVGQMLN